MKVTLDLWVLYVSLSSSSLKHQHCNAAFWVRYAVTALSIITACIIDHSIMEMEMKYDRVKLHTWDDYLTLCCSNIHCIYTLCCAQGAAGLHHRTWVCVRACVCGVCAYELSYMAIPHSLWSSLTCRIPLAIQHSVCTFALCVRSFVVGITFR